ncbi:MAG: hypothetical protein ACI9FR_002441 [Cryomorphaceae bacterium]|jgi:hypothetical protein
MKSQKNSTYLEHTNITVADPDSLAELLCALFDWRIRWSGASIHDGYSVHVGGDHSYLALYTNKQVLTDQQRGHSILHNLNHVAVVVPDLASVEAKVKNKGLEPFNFGNYEPDSRFYFYTEAGLEVEVVSYP